jgi:hypothetical protein
MRQWKVTYHLERGDKRCSPSLTDRVFSEGKIVPFEDNGKKWTETFADPAAAQAALVKQGVEIPAGAVLVFENISEVS